MAWGPGHEKLSTWFELSYASFATVPRILMEAMPDEWQGKMADLLTEYEDTFPHQGHLPGTRVQAVKDNKLVPFPPWLLNYRRPDQDEINKLRANAPAES